MFFKTVKLCFILDSSTLNFINSHYEAFNVLLILSLVYKVDLKDALNIRK